MRLDRRKMLLYAVTDSSWTDKLCLIDQVEAALDNGATCLQFRDKQLEDRQFLDQACSIKRICNKYNVPFIVNNNVSAAVECGADGIHIGQDDMNPADVRKIAGDDMIIGVSTHSVDEALRAVQDGADYLGLGAVFGSSTKADTTGMSLQTLHAICGAVDIPTVAIGGISAENIYLLRGSGIDGIAVISAIFSADDPGKATAEIFELAKETVYLDSGKPGAPLFVAQKNKRCRLKGDFNENSIINRRK